MNSNSVSQVGSFPVKLLKQWAKGPSPLHLQLWPTYRCDANCEWCSCRDARQAREQLHVGELCEVVRLFASRGAKALTLSGGGEPTMVPGISDVMRVANANRMAVGLITNGNRLAADGALAAAVDEFASWVRVSITSHRASVNHTIKIETIANRVRRARLGVKFIIPYITDEIAQCHAVVSAAEEVIAVADRTRVDHVLFVMDNRGPRRHQNVDQLEIVRRAVAHSSKAILHESRPSFGAETCRLGTVRPVVAPDGYVYPCCMVHIARGVSALPESARICKWYDYKQQTAIVDGSACERCFFSEYNTLLGRVAADVEDEVFV